VATSVVCRGCGATMAANRPQCLRCGEDLVAVDSVERNVVGTGAIPAWLASRSTQLTLAGIALSLVATLVVGPNAPIPVPSRATDLGKTQGMPARTTEAPGSAAKHADEATLVDSDMAGRAAYARGDFQAALDDYQRAVDTNPNDPNALNNLAQCLV